MRLDPDRRTLCGWWALPGVRVRRAEEPFETTLVEAPFTATHSTGNARTMEAGRTSTDWHCAMAKIDLTKQSGRPRPPRTPARQVQAYILLGFGAVDLLNHSPIGVVFILLGCYLLYRSRIAPGSVPELGPVGNRRADEVMALAPTALPDWWSIDQYRARVVPVGDANQSTFPLVDLQGQVTGVIARADLDQVAPTDTADVRLRDLARRRRRPMVLVPRESSLNAVAGSVVLNGAIAVVVNADKHPLGVITRSEIARMRDPAS